MVSLPNHGIYFLSGVGIPQNEYVRLPIVVVRQAHHDNGVW